MRTRGTLLLLSILSSCSREPPSTVTPLAASPPAVQKQKQQLVDPAPVSVVIEKVLPSVVHISSSKTISARVPSELAPFFEDFFGGDPRFQGPDQREVGIGSGVIVSADGFIVTNNHVVENAAEINVTFANRREMRAKVVGADPLSDLAVVRVEGASDLTPIAWGDSDAANLGDTVLAFGDPFGVGETVTMGIVSAKGRADVGIVSYEDFIQTDAAINPGNSGGPLTNLRGEIVGINTAIVSRTGGYQGIGFAIPSNMARSIVDSLRSSGKVVRGFVGVAVQQIDAQLADALGLESVEGVLLTDVSPDGPAARAGIKAGDVVLAIDGQKVETTGQLRNLVARQKVGSKVTMIVRRGKEKIEAPVTIAELPARFSRPSEQEPPEPQAEPGALGLRAVMLDEELRSQLRLPDRIDHGIVVVAVAPDGVAANAGLSRGDVILEANRRPVDSALDLEREFRGARSLLLRVYREGAFAYVVLRRNGEG